jgi:phosphomevalonate kinase
VKAGAPGKLLLTGAYAVLEGAPAIVVAIDRVAIADASRTAREPTPEVCAALGAAAAPEVDAHALYDEEGRKLGLGSSAAILVASLGVHAAVNGADLAEAAVRRKLFDDARAAHARVQSGGSGVDVAASVYGGVLRYETRKGGAEIRTAALPDHLVLQVWWSGQSARTAELRARVDALRERAPETHAARFAALNLAAHVAADAVEAGSLVSFVGGARACCAALERLGEAADAPIVPPRFAELAPLAAAEDAAFLPSGAGGGDVAVWLGRSAPSAAFAARAAALGFRVLRAAIDPGGVRLFDRSQ